MDVRWRGGKEKGGAVLAPWRERGRMGDGCETGLWSTVDQVICQYGGRGGAQQHTDVDSVPEHPGSG